MIMINLIALALAHFGAYLAGNSKVKREEARIASSRFWLSADFLLHFFEFKQLSYAF